MRKDAAENRQRLLIAAREIVRQHGDDAPLELITEKAGVTRATLYRNFADRTELYQAVLEHEIEVIRGEIDVAEGCGLFEVMRKLIDVSDIYHAFASASQNTSEPGEACSPAPLLSLIAAPLENAKVQGMVRQSLTPEEVLLACRMVSYGWKLDGEPDQRVAINRRLLLVIRGLSGDLRWIPTDPTASDPADRIHRNAAAKETGPEITEA
ncbi:TetR/AcrR family transcriptional regulator [Rhizobium sp. RU36D]|uniref:TetR/AcrR family transcriptional regulator n=1 Tax=Rhizobium sp. RU36D TaxID=1907415 RepID=UPI0009D79EA7|nr:TetR/AcrR family transcriptional regulator [Rhizobium sp. RU36D]SMC93628.1 transcriptional regulator, TetR family [Rhizobium sp. RU36D]